MEKREQNCISTSVVRPIIQLDSLPVLTQTLSYELEVEDNNCTEEKEGNTISHNLDSEVIECKKPLLSHAELKDLIRNLSLLRENVELRGLRLQQ